MKIHPIIVVCCALVLAPSCRTYRDDPVISQQYVHKYGYAISKAEWESKNYPGQVITHFRDGVTITATYEAGKLHGPYSKTYPHSQTVEYQALYDQGNVAKELYFSSRGMPVKEIAYLSPTRRNETTWYASGSPKSIEEFSGDEIYEAEYLSMKNEIESTIEKSQGLRIVRDREGKLLAKEEIREGYATKRDSFYPNGALESTAYFSKGKAQGDRRTFSEAGEPLAIEEWVGGQLHGKTTLFNNGAKYLEISYLNGMKNGAETHYIDGEIVVQESHWTDNKKHGVTTYYTDNFTRSEWFYDDKPVSKERWEELTHLDEVITHVSEDLKVGDLR